MNTRNKKRDGTSQEQQPRLAKSVGATSAKASVKGGAVSISRSIQKTALKKQKEVEAAEAKLINKWTNPQ